MPLPYRHEDAPGLAEGAALGAVVGAMVGEGLGGVVGVDDPPHEEKNASAPRAGRVRRRLIFITLVTPIRRIRIFDDTPSGPAGQAGFRSANSRQRRGLDWNVSPAGLYRAPALVPLSRDHHEALIQALWLRRRAGRPEAARIFLDFQRAELEGHMADEEDVVLPLADRVDPAGCARIREEHGRLRSLAASLRSGMAAGSDLAPVMGDLARLLHDHVRYEERVFFMDLQAALSPEVLASLGAALEAHREARGVAAACRIRPR